MRSRPNALLVLTLATAAAGCRILPDKPGITVASDPPGARVIVDGRDSGFVTPCVVALDPSENYRIDLARPGYVTASRYLTSDKRVYVLYWREMFLDPRTFRFPLWLNFGDFFLPVKYERGESPERIYVRLERAADR